MSGEETLDGSDSGSQASSPCPVCDGTGDLLGDPCPLCGDEEPADDAPPRKEGLYRCEVCCKDLQSAATLQEHLRGRKHLRRAPGCTPVHRQRAQALTEEELFERLAAGEFRRVVVITGAGVSTAAGIPDFRSHGGLFEGIQANWAGRFPELWAEPERLLSQNFADSQPRVWTEEVLPWLSAMKWEGAAPTATHHFCGWLSRRGWLRRVYTQNVDGLHVHEDVGLPQQLVVECHGALRDGSIVLYGNSLPASFDRACRQDFPPSSAEAGVDLLIVLGTSLQVAPVCGVPNMAPRGCARVLVNRSLADCAANAWSPRPRQRCGYYDTSEIMDCHYAPATSVPIGAHKRVALRPLWRDARACRRWRQLLVEANCDDFVTRFFESPAAQRCGHKLRD